MAENEQEKMDLSVFLDDYLNDVGKAFQEFDDTLLVLEKDANQPELWDEVFRAAHTLKGASRMMEFFDIQEVAHIWENLLDLIRQKELKVTQEIMDILFDARDTLEEMVNERGKERKDTISEPLEVRCLQVQARIESAINDPKQDDSFDEAEESTGSDGVESPTISKIPVIDKGKVVRVNVDLLDNLFDLAGELIITKNRVDNLVSGIDTKDLRDTLCSMDRMIKQLRESIAEARLVPVDEVFRKFPRMVRDLGKSVNKEVNLVISGREIELDKGMLDSISEPLIHILRNAVDHGVESPDERERQQKPKTANIKLSALRDENSVIFEVEDDGAGVDPEKIKESAIEKGFISHTEAESMSDQALIDLLFKPGFSSAREITDISGRGVGLDVVNESVKELGGSVEVVSQKGHGSRFIMHLPLSTAIMQTLMVSIGDYLFAIPSTNIENTQEIKFEDIREIGDQKVVHYRGRILHYLPLNEILNIGICQQNQQSMTMLILSHGEQDIAVGVDEVVDHIENIIKPFDPIARNFHGYAGGTIMGDGRVALLLDIPSLVNSMKTREECVV